MVELHADYLGTNASLDNWDPCSHWLVLLIHSQDRHGGDGSRNRNSCHLSSDASDYNCEQSLHPKYSWLHLLARWWFFQKLERVLPTISPSYCDDLCRMVGVWDRRHSIWNTRRGWTRLDCHFVQCLRSDVHDSSGNVRGNMCNHRQPNWRQESRACEEILQSSLRFVRLNCPSYIDWSLPWPLQNHLIVH